MTRENHGRDRRLEDQLYVDALLAEAGFDAGSADDDGLRDALLRLRSFRTTDVPVPCAELVALMEGSGTALAEVIPLAGRDRKHPRRKRAVLTSLAVAASLGIAGGAAAGNETVRRHAAGTIDTILRSFSPPAFFPPAEAPAGPHPAASSPAQPAEAPAGTPDVVLSHAAGPLPGTSEPGQAPGRREAPGRTGAGAENRTPAEKEHAPARAVPPSPAPQESEGTRKPAGSAAPGVQDQPGRPSSDAVPLASPEDSAAGPGATHKPDRAPQADPAPAAGRGLTP